MYLYTDIGNASESSRVDSTGINVDGDEAFNGNKNVNLNGNSDIIVDLNIINDDNIVDNSRSRSYPPMSATTVHPSESTGRGPLPSPVKQTPLLQPATPPTGIHEYIHV